MLPVLVIENATMFAFLALRHLLKCVLQLATRIPLLTSNEFVRNVVDPLFAKGRMCTRVSLPTKLAPTGKPVTSNRCSMPKLQRQPMQFLQQLCP